MKHCLMSPLILLAVILMTTTIVQAEPPPAARPIITLTSMYESHSDENNPDNYVYNVVSITRHLEGGVLGSVFYMHKQNLETNDEGGQAAGANVIKMFSSSSYALVGFTYAINEVDSTLATRTDNDRVRIGYYHKVYERAERSHLLLSAVYNTQTDWSESRTVDFGIAYRHGVASRWAAVIGYKYTRAVGDLDMHVFDQWSADITYRMNDTTDLNAGYLLVDKLFTGPAPGLEPEDDRVFRAALRYRFK
ncbi:MAG TPA: hypothetical protein PLF13_14155 [candidate division Zixibacteria bacterium]|nr:hypothetical protein [candidate division Zixibacteria bacterium]